jgi:(p)ppGpp synthase/HD superfamily hydrolase
MTYTLADARKLATDIFKRSFDYTGVPYMGHLEVVTDALEVFDEDLQVVGMLHSILEHSDWTAQTLLEEGVPRKSVDTIVTLTRNTEIQTDAMYFRQVRVSEDAVLVKIACTAHNHRPERLDFRPSTYRTRRFASEGFSERHLWPAAYEDDLRDVLRVAHPELLERVERLKGENKL